MKLYDSTRAPSARRVRMFLAEKGLDVERVEIDLQSGEHLGEAYRAINPQCQVPCLELDNGVRIAESIAICRYFEAVEPRPPMFGTTPEEIGVTEMWARYVENNGWLTLVEFIRNGNERFAGRALPGPVDYAQIPDLARRAERRWTQFLDTLDGQLSEQRFVCGDGLTNTDLTAFITIDAAGVFGLETRAGYAHVQRWFEDMKARPSADA